MDEIDFGVDPDVGTIKGPGNIIDLQVMPDGRLRVVTERGEWFIHRLPGSEKPPSSRH